MQQHSGGGLSSLLFAPLLLCQGFAVCIAPFEKGLCTIVENKKMISKKYIELIADLNSCRTATVPKTPDHLPPGLQHVPFQGGLQGEIDEMHDQCTLPEYMWASKEDDVGGGQKEQKIGHFGPVADVASERFFHNESVTKGQACPESCW